MSSGTTVAALIVAVEDESTWWAFLPLRPPAPGWKECEGRYLWPADVHERALLEAAAQPITAGERGFVVRGPKEVVPRGAVLLDGVSLREVLPDVAVMNAADVTAADAAFAAIPAPIPRGLEAGPASTPRRAPKRKKHRNTFAAGFHA
jgi:hypothetical protein